VAVTYKICGIVVLYNPDITVVEKIYSYIDQVNHLILFDNSSVSQLELLQSISAHPNFHYYPQYENRGIAAAINFAADYAVAHGYDFLLTMDQDSSAPESMVEDLLAFAGIREKIGIISPYHSNIFRTKEQFTEKYLLVETIKTSGNLLNLSCYSAVGKFEEGYFIDYVDIEYCFRLGINGYAMVQVNTVILDHQEAAFTRRKFFTRTVYPYNNVPIRMYYKTRNLLFLRKKYRRKLPGLVKIEMDTYRNNLIKLLLYEESRVFKLKMIAKGIWHFVRGKKGRYS
jgi:rhamnosyltransferase